MKPPFFTGLPSAAELAACPDRALFAALEATLVLAVRVLTAQQLGLENGDPTDAPLLLLNEAVQASALSLHTLLVAYDDLTKRMVELDRGLTSHLAGSDEPF